LGGKDENMTTLTTAGEPGNAGLRTQMRGEERRIESQHERLDSLCQELYWLIDKDGPTHAIGECLLFITALDAHMTMEEDVFFPVLYGLHDTRGASAAGFTQSFVVRVAAACILAAAAIVICC
jgi:hypothetical protein